MRRDVIWSEEAEQAVIGSAIMGKQAAVNAVMIRLEPEHFYRPAHQVLFRAIAEMIRKRQKPDAVPLKNYLEERGELRSVGGEDYIVACMEKAALSNASQYADIVRRDYSCRQVIAALKSAGSKFMGREDLEEAQSILREVTKPTGVGGCQSIDKLDMAAPVAGQKSHLGIVNRSTECGGWPKGQVSIIGAYPGSGKTTMLIQDWIHATEAGKRTVYATFGDLTGREIMSKVMRQATGWSHPPRQSNLITPDDWQRVLGDWQVAHDASVYEARKVQGDRGRRIGVFCDEMRAHSDAGELGIVYLDYIQKVHPDKPAGSDVEDLKRISDQLQILAEELNIPIVTGTQLTNTVEGPQPKSCRAIYEDCALAVYLYWMNGYQTKDSSQPLWQLSRPDEGGGRAKFRLYKNRFGPPGWDEAVWSEQYAKFEVAA